MSNTNKSGKREVIGFLGVGLDHKDGHQRISRSEHFFLVGGSAETHEHLQDTAIRFTASLQRRGKTLQETSPEEALDLLDDALDD